MDTIELLRTLYAPLVACGFVLAVMAVGSILAMRHAGR